MVDENEKLLKLVKAITETGEWLLDPDKLKLLKSFCKQSDQNVQLAFECIMSQLKKKHAQIRYSSLQLIEQLFERSRYFRNALTEDFPLFTQLTIGIHDKKLPPPIQVATKLREYAIALIKSWYIQYGEKYRQISIAYDFLLDNAYFNKQGNSLSSIHTDAQNKSNIQARRKATHLTRFELLKIDINDHISVIQDNLTNMEVCFEILIPKHNFITDDLDFDALLRGEASSNQTSSKPYKENIVSHGLGSNRYKIVIDLSEESLTEDVVETNDNKIIYDQLRETYTLLETKHIKQVNHWINTLAKIELSDKAEKEQLVKQLIDLRGRASEVSNKAKLLHIQVLQCKKDKRINSDNIEDEEDEFGDEMFEEINMSEISGPVNQTLAQSSNLPPTQRIFPLSFEPSMIEDATYNGPEMMEVSELPDIKGKGKQKENLQREELLKRAPTVEWGDDLYYWDKKNVQFNSSGIEPSHRFMGVGEGINELPNHLLEQLRKRPTYYKSETPKELPVNTKITVCRFPLHKGDLCPRRDIKTCPFHGPVIPRDNFGRPINKEDAEKEEKESKSMNQDPDETYGVTSRDPDPVVLKNLWELLEDNVVDPIERQKLLSTHKNPMKKQKKKSSLINIKKKPSDSYSRLERHMNSKKIQKMAEEAKEYEREMKSQNKQANDWR